MATDSNITPELAMRYRHEKKSMPCRVCGEPIEVGIRTRKEPRCFNCGLKAALDAARQMAEKKGPYYDAWLASRPMALKHRWGGTPKRESKSGGESSL